MPWKFFRKKSGGKVLVDDWMHNWLNTPEERQRPVDPDELFRLIDLADRLVVKEMALSYGEVLFESTQRADFDELKAALTIVVPEEGFHAMCIGEPAIELFVNGTPVAEIANIGGNHIRWWNHWHSDAMLANSEPWLEWFSQRGIDGPRDEVESARRRAKESALAEKRWLAAMPPCLAPVWEQSQDEWGRVDTDLLSVTLNRSVPNRDERIRALLHWYGSGTGRWSGYPGYEMGAGNLLLAEPHDALVTVSQSPDLSSTQLEGAARLFGGWDYSKKYPGGTDALPASLKQRLWERVEGTDDEDKLSRATRAFRSTT